jgi:hypothetical protein
MIAMTGTNRDFYGCIAESVGKKGPWKRRVVEKSKGGTFPLRLEIPQEQRDFHFFTAPEGVKGTV